MLDIFIKTFLIGFAIVLNLSLFIWFVTFAFRGLDLSVYKSLRKERTEVKEDLPSISTQIIERKEEIDVRDFFKLPDVKIESSFQGKKIGAIENKNDNVKL